MPAAVEFLESRQLLTAAPVISNVETVYYSYSANAPAVQVTGTLTLSDADSTTLAGASIWIDSNFSIGHDLLSYTPVGSITGVFNSTTGKLTLSGTETLANYQSALRSIKYSNDSGNPSLAVRRFNIQANDTTQSSASTYRYFNTTSMLSNLQTANYSYAEDAGPIVLSSTLILANTINGTISGASVRIDANYVEFEDVLSFADTGTITSSWNSTTGTLVLSGTDSVGNYQAALRAVKYRNTSGNPSTSIRRFRFEANGGTSEGLQGYRYFNIIPSNDGPEISNVETVNYSYRLNAPAVPVTSTLTLADVDSVNLASASIQIDANYVKDQDFLTFTAVGAISGSFNATTGTLSLSGVDTVSNYQAALRSVQYYRTEGNPGSLVRRFRILANDGLQSSVAASRYFSITSMLSNVETVNYVFKERDPATAITSTLTVANTYNGTVAGATIQIDANYVDGEDELSFTNTGTITGSWDHVAGILTLSGTDSVANYQAALQAVKYRNDNPSVSTAVRRFKFVINGGTTSGLQANRYFTIAAVNDSPVQLTGTISNLTVLEDAAATSLGLGSVTFGPGGGSDESSQGLTYRVTTIPASSLGTILLADGTTAVTASTAYSLTQLQGMKFRPVANANGTGSFVFTVQDTGGTANGGVDTLTKTVTVSVTPVNDAPSGTAKTVTTPEDTAYTFTVSDFGFSDVNDSPVNTLAAVKITTIPAAGDLKNNGTSVTAGQFISVADIIAGKLVFTPGANVTGNNYANFSFQVQDNGSGTAPNVNLDPIARSITINVVDLNHAPAGTPKTLTMLEDDAYVFVASDFGFTDPNDSPVNAFTAVKIVAIPVSGSLKSNGTTVTAGQSVTIADINGGKLVFTPASNANGSSYANFTFQVQDDGGTAVGGSDMDATPRLMTINVTAVNDVPIMTAGSVSALSVNEDSAATSLGLGTLTFGTGGGSDEATQTLTYKVTTAPAGSLGKILLADGTTIVTAGTSYSLSQMQGMKFWATADANGSGTFVFAVQDSGGTSNGGIDTLAISQMINVIGVNDAPTLSGTGSLTHTENDAPTAINPSIAISDIDSTTLKNGSVTISNFIAGEDGLGFTNDGSTMGNIAGVFNSSTGVLSLTSADSSATLAQWQAALRAVTYTNSSNNPTVTTRNVVFSVDDGESVNSASNSVTRAITVTPVNDAPLLAGAGSISYTENDPAATINGALTVSDVDSTTLASATVTITNFVSSEDLLGFVSNSSTMGNIAGSFNASTGVMTLTSNQSSASLAQWQAALRSVIYWNNSHAPTTTARLVSFTIDDGKSVDHASNSVVSVVNITSVNDAPVLSAWTTINYVENTPFMPIDTAITVIDRDNATLAYGTVAIANYVIGEDLLLFSAVPATMGNVTGRFDTSTGVLSLESSGATATLLQWQAALRSVTYSNTSQSPTTSSRFINFFADDGQLSGHASNLLTCTVNVVAVNDPPILTGAIPVTYRATDPAVALMPAAVVSDLDDTSLVSTRITITNVVPSEDLLRFSSNALTMGNITGSFDNATGVLLLTSAGGTATLAQWQVALRVVSYENANGDPTIATRTVQVTLNDGHQSNSLVNTITIRGANEAPVLSGTSAWSFGATATPTAINQNILVSDANNATLSQGTVTITNFILGEDVLGFSANAATMGNITATIDNAAGTVELVSANATATLAEWQAALRALTYNNTSSTPTATIRSIVFAVDDGQPYNHGSNTLMSSVGRFNTAPVLSTLGGSVYVASDPATPINPTIAIADLDDLTLKAAVVSMTNFVVGEDVLAFYPNPSTMGDIGGVVNNTLGSITLTSPSGTATLMQWQTALRSMTYANVSATPTLGGRSVVFTVDDGHATGHASNMLSSTMSVYAYSTPAALSGRSTTAYTMGDTAIVVNPSIKVSSIHGTTLESASVVLQNVVAGEDVLGFVSDPASMGNIVGSYNGTTGVLSLSSSGATATLAQWQSALRLVTFVNSSSTPRMVTRYAIFTVTDSRSANHVSNAISSEVTFHVPSGTSTVTGLSFTPSGTYSGKDVMYRRQAASGTLAGAVSGLAAGISSIQIDCNSDGTVDDVFVLSGSTFGVTEWIPVGMNTVSVRVVTEDSTTGARLVGDWISFSTDVPPPRESPRIANLSFWISQVYDDGYAFGAVRGRIYDDNGSGSAWSYRIQVDIDSDGIADSDSPQVDNSLLNTTMWLPPATTLIRVRVARESFGIIGEWQSLPVSIPAPFTASPPSVAGMSFNPNGGYRNQSYSNPNTQEQGILHVDLIGGYYGIETLEVDLNGDGLIDRSDAVLADTGIDLSVLVPLGANTIRARILYAGFGPQFGQQLYSDWVSLATNLAAPAVSQPLTISNVAFTPNGNYVGNNEWGLLSYVISGPQYSNCLLQIDRDGNGSFETTQGVAPGWSGNWGQNLSVPLGPNTVNVRLAWSDPSLGQQLFYSAVFSLQTDVKGPPGKSEVGVVANTHAVVTPGAGLNNVFEFSFYRLIDATSKAADVPYSIQMDSAQWIDLEGFDNLEPGDVFHETIEFGVPSAAELAAGYQVIQMQVTVASTANATRPKTFRLAIDPPSEANFQYDLLHGTQLEGIQGLDRRYAEADVLCTIYQGVTVATLPAVQVTPLANPDSSALDWNDFKQTLGNCYLIAALMAATRKDAAQLRSMITFSGNKIVVTFPNEMPIELPFDLDRGDDMSDMNACDTDVNGNVEMWPVILEAAFAQLRSPGTMPFSGIGNGDAAVAYRQVTGRLVSFIFPSGAAAAANFPDETEVYSSSRSEIVLQISAALQSGRQVMMSTGGEPAAGGVLGAHVYVVTEISNDRITIINPLASGKTPGYPNGISVTLGKWFDDDIKRFMICQ